MLLILIFFGQFWQKELKIGSEGRRKKKFVRENPHHTPQMINGRPLRAPGRLARSDLIADKLTFSAFQQWFRIENRKIT